MTFPYSSRYGMLGMMSKRFEVLGDWQGFRKNKTNAISFYTDFNPPFKNVFYSYIYEKPEGVKASKMTQVVSRLDENFFNLAGREFREIRETRNKFNKLLKIGEYDAVKTQELISLWDKVSGPKYGWHRHSGYDRTFFERWFEAEKENLFSRFYYQEDQLVGYSVLHRTEQGYEYLIRKSDNRVRNTCLYVDYKTFEEIYAVEQKPFLINWGASSGTLLKYKKKFPVAAETPVYFYKVVNS